MSATWASKAVGDLEYKLNSKLPPERQIAADPEAGASEHRRNEGYYKSQGDGQSRCSCSTQADTFAMLMRSMVETEKRNSEERGRDRARKRGRDSVKLLHSSLTLWEVGILYGYRVPHSPEQRLPQAY